jgi:two-component sensor histidine kinase/tetratricopeptide (TPR) repeat protein
MKRLLLLFGLLTAGLSGQAEPLYPLLSSAAAESLRTRLQRAPADTNRVAILLQLSSDLLAKHDELDTPLGDAYAYSRQAVDLSQTLHFTPGIIQGKYNLGQFSTMSGDTAAAQAEIRQALALSKQAANKPLEALGWYFLGNAYARVEAEFPAKTQCYQRAKDLYAQLGDRAKEAYLLKTIADMHLLQGNSVQAVHELLEVVALYRAASQPRLHYTYDLLRGAHRQMGNYKEALRYGLASIESAQATQDTSSIGGFYTRTAVLYMELKQLPEAKRYFTKALANMRQNKLNLVFVAGEMSRLLIAQKQPAQALAFLQAYLRENLVNNQLNAMYAASYLAECYLALKQYGRAEHYYLQLLPFTQTGMQNDMTKAGIYRMLGQFYLQSKQYNKARLYLGQALAGSMQNGYLLRVAEIHLWLFRADSAQARFPAAIAHYQRYKALTDSVFNEAKNKQLASLQIQYDTRKKEQNIALLTKQTLLQQSSLREKEAQRNALLGGAVLLAMLLGLGYNRYRLKQRSNQLLEAQQHEINQQNQSLQHLLAEKEDLLAEKDWMLKEIHHRVKNNLQVISSLLDTQSDYLRDPAALAAIREGQNRVHAMALIHQKLYQSTRLAEVNMAEYIREITEYLLDSFDRRAVVQVRLAVAPIELDVTLATPIGLIINEALTNALKYAFPTPRRGTIVVELAEVGPQRYQLIIADDGVGFPPGFSLADNHTMGLTIMEGLSQQIDGVLTITPADGVRISLEFEVTAKVALPLAS